MQGGFAAGDKAVLILDKAQPAERMSRLTDIGIDAKAAQ
jgi:hypothetical protein